MRRAAERGEAITHRASEHDTKDIDGDCSGIARERLLNTLREKGHDRGVHADEAGECPADIPAA